jgi:dCTP diphosphatase
MASPAAKGGSFSFLSCLSSTSILSCYHSSSREGPGKAGYAPDLPGGGLTRKTRKALLLSESLDHIKHQLRKFVADRDWDQFHSPKNLAMALIVEAAELVEHFQWLKEEESAALSPDKLAEVEQELADIQIYLIRLADKLNVDLMKAVDSKIELNEKKYPADKARGSSMKYTEYQE